MGDLVPIGNLFNLEKGRLQSTKCTPGEYDFITAAEDWKTHHKYAHECEALIIAVAASGSLGRTHYVDGKFISSDLCFILTPKNEEKYPLSLAFYHFVFNSLRSVLVAATKSGTSKESINQTNFKKYALPYFDIEQQNLWIKKLKSTLVEKDLLGSELTHQQNLLKKLRQQILQEAIEGKLTEDWRKQNPNVEPASELLKRIQDEKQQLIQDKKIKKQKPLPAISEDEKPFALPDGWAWCRLGETTNIVRGGSPRPAGDIRFYKGNIPFLKVADLTATRKMYLDKHTYTIKKAGLHKTRLVPENTLMLTNSGATLGIPKICRFKTTFNDGIAAFIYMNEELYKPYFYQMLSSKTQWFLEEASRGQGQPNLNTDIIGETIIPLPPLAEQKAIVTKVEKLLTLCDQLQTQISQNQHHADQLMQAVLKEAFNGIEN